MEPVAEAGIAAPGPFHLIFSADSLRDKPVRLRLAANAVQCKALADLNNLVEVKSCEAEFEISRFGRSGARVSGDVSAQVVQTCVVTLEPFEASVRERFELKFVPPAAPAAAPNSRFSKVQVMKDLPERVIEHHLDEEDEPEEMVDGKIDLGALAVEFFTLGLDPYPRKPGADLGAVAEGISHLEVNAPDVDESATSPFATLAKLKPGPKTSD